MRLLLGVDLREPSEALLATTAAWAARLGATVDLAYVDVLRPSPVFLDDPHFGAMLRAELDRMIQEDADALAKRLEILPEAQRGATWLSEGNPATELTRRAGEYDAIVVGTHGRTGLSHLWLGSVAEQVVRKSTRPTLVLRPRELGSHARMLLAVDLKEPSEGLVAQAAAWGERIGATIDLVHVEEVPSPLPHVSDPTIQAQIEANYEKFHAAYERDLTKLAEQIPQANRGNVSVTSGAPATALLALAHDYDLVAMGTHGRTGLLHAWFGSVAERVARRAPCSVLLLRPA